MSDFASDRLANFCTRRIKRGLPSKSALAQSDLSAMASFRYAVRKFLRFSKELLASEGHLTVEQYEALLALRASESSAGMQVGQPSERLQVRHHTTVALTNKLMERGLVSKRRAGDDRRHVYVRLTTAGTQVIDHLAAHHRREISARSGEMIGA